MMPAINEITILARDLTRTVYLHPNNGDNVCLFMAGLLFVSPIL